MPKVKVAKKKAKAQKKKAKAKKTTPGQMMRGANLPSKRGVTMKMVKGMDFKMCNPFNANTMGCKYPDGLAGFTIPLQVRGLASLSTSGTSGQNLYGFGAGFPYNFVGISAYAAPTYTIGSGAASFTNATLTTILTNGGTLRPVCGGIILRSQQSAMNAQGTVIVTKMPAGIQTTGSWTTGTLYGDARSYPLVAGFELCVLFKPQGPVAYDFQAVNTTAMEARDWDQILVEYIGGSTTGPTPVLEVEYIVNYEVIPSSANVAYQQLASPTKDNPVARHVTKSVWDKVGSFISGGVDQVTDKLGKLALEAGATALGGYFGGPQGAIMGGSSMAMLVD